MFLPAKICLAARVPIGKLLKNQGNLHELKILARENP
jgi:hypothetical protein